MKKFLQFAEMKNNQGNLKAIKVNIVKSTNPVNLFTKENTYFVFGKKIKIKRFYKSTFGRVFKDKPYNLFVMLLLF